MKDMVLHARAHARWKRATTERHSQFFCEESTQMRVRNVSRIVSARWFDLRRSAQSTPS
jgi:hypothetical protein